LGQEGGLQVPAAFAYERATSVEHASALLGMRDFHRGPSRAAAGPAEMLVEIRVAAPDRAGGAVTDQRGSAEYKRHVVGVLVERVRARATARTLQQEEG
jgi:CO/xanthine dehydrogenase FAD-binding subunit